MNQQKQIAIFLPALYGGGAERTMLNLAQGIANCGYAVDLVLAQVEGPYLTEIPESVRLVDLGQGILVNNNRTLKRLPALVRYLRREQPDAMLSALNRANFVALWARRLAGTPQRLVINEQNTLSQDALNAQFRLAWLLPYLAKYFYRWADSVVGVSQGVADDLVQVVGIPKQLVKVIYNPGVMPGISEKAKSPLDHPWFQPGEPPVLLAVGRLTKQKDFTILIKAFALLRQSRSARLLIVGEGPERQMLETLIQQLDVKEDISIPGFIENPYAYMGRASVFILSSLWEGLPTVLMEALFCGAPIVATDCPSGPREILRNGEDGRLVPMNDHIALAEAMAAALDGKVPPPSQESWQPYTLETIVEQYINILLGD
ncbi:MAG: glycosyltransferase [Planctomycetota bacterium]|jgi:glycosyltransferase involved in cell wall biosynthesis